MAHSRQNTCVIDLGGGFRFADAARASLANSVARTMARVSDCVVEAESAGQPEQATGSEAGRRQSWQEPKDRKESRVRRVAWDPQAVRRRERS